MFNGLQHCSVPICGNNDLRSPDDTFHSLPELDSVREAWIKKCHLRSKWERLGIKPLFRDSLLTVCSQHFSDGDYCNPEQFNTGSCRRILMPEAIPSLDLPPEDFFKPPPINWKMKKKFSSVKFKAKLQLEKLNFWTMHTGTMQDYRTALLRNCTFDGIQGKCHSINSLKIMGLFIPNDGDKEKLSWKTGISFTAIQNICHYHDYRLLKYSGFMPKCCDPFKKHKLGQRTYHMKRNYQRRPYTVVSPSLYEKLKYVAPQSFLGAPICNSCAAEVNMHLSKLNTSLRQVTVATSKSTTDATEASAYLSKLNTSFHQETVATSKSTVDSVEASMYPSKVNTSLQQETMDATEASTYLSELNTSLQQETAAKSTIAAAEASMYLSKLNTSLQQETVATFKSTTDTAEASMYLSKVNASLQKETIATSQSTTDAKNGINGVEVCADMTAEVGLGTVLPSLEVAAPVRGCVKRQHEFGCDCCSLVLANEVSLVDHLMWDHLNELVLPRSCKYCNKAFDIKIAYNRHVSLHLKENKNQGTSISGHKTRESKSKETFFCRICFREFKQRWDLKLHEAECRRSLQKIQNSLFQFYCYFCKQKFHSEANLDEHVTVSHKKPNFLYEILFECSVCHENFHRGSFVSHIKLHGTANGSGSTVTSEQSDGNSLLTNRPICNIKYGAHLQHTHTGTSVSMFSNLESRPDEEVCVCCDFCRIILSKSELNNHLSESHTVTKWYSCKTCGQRFQSAIECMKHHKAANHKGKRDNKVCGVCNKKCSTKRHLREHKHYGEKRAAKFSCSLCGKGFRLVKTLFEHHVLKHGDIDLLNEPAYVTESVIDMDIDIDVTVDMPFFHNVLDVYIL